MARRGDLPRGERSGQRGSALLIVVFFAAVMIISAGAAMPSLLTQGQRDREEEMIWRGKQYARAVKLFYRKNGRFPQSMDDLVKPQLNVRFLRQAYEDPMNKEDGSWRLIYVGANGQLIGSTTRPNMLLNIPQQRPGDGAGGPGQPAGGAGATGSTGASGAGTSGTGTGVSQTTPGTLGSGAIIGGNIIGVGSKVAKSSIKVYNGQQIYRDWEFLWDPTQDAIQQGQPGVGGPQPGTPAGQPTGGPGVRPPGGTGVRRP
jgi:type II secretory pathway pseudopilin PulG